MKKLTVFLIVVGLAVFSNTSWAQRAPDAGSILSEIVRTITPRLGTPHWLLDTSTLPIEVRTAAREVAAEYKGATGSVKDVLICGSGKRCHLLDERGVIALTTMAVQDDTARVTLRYYFPANGRAAWSAATFTFKRSGERWVLIREQGTGMS